MGRADAAVRLLPLFIGRLDFVRLDLTGADVALFRNAESVSNWANAPSAERGRIVVDTEHDQSWRMM